MRDTRFSGVTFAIEKVKFVGISRNKPGNGVYIQILTEGRMERSQVNY